VKLLFVYVFYVSSVHTREMANTASLGGVLVALLGGVLVALLGGVLGGVAKHIGEYF
jgi:hypothetical protein